MQKERDPVIVQALRTPIADHRGVFKDVPAENLLVVLIKEVMKRSKIDPERIEDAIFGNCQAHETGNMARVAALKAGLPLSVPGMTLERQCTSGMEAISLSVNGIKVGEGDVYLCGGVESMTRRPYVLPKPPEAYMRVPPKFVFPFQLSPPEVGNPPMGITAENLAEKYGISREEQEVFALKSHQKAVRAIKEGRFRDEIVPVVVPQRKGDPIVVDTDTHPREDTSLEKMARLPPVFKEDGTVTAATSSPVTDGAAILMIVSRAVAESCHMEILGRVVSHAVVGNDPNIMGIGPAFSIPKALARAGMTLDQMDLVELNEAFAAQCLAVLKELKAKGTPIDEEKLNVNGGAIALGHPIAASGARIVVTMLHEMKRRDARYGLAALCGGGGVSSAMVIERESGC
ncbi:MAG: thiolase family protein [Deltaproteobacteria bacterium]|nr:thiolase family protein [Deltaproteobacteria bacterium]MBW2120236.1 thiolase family protein [Deltaproteobacteria bacterium]